jgi:hypothetical protein
MNYPYNSLKPDTFPSGSQPVDPSLPPLSLSPWSPSPPSDVAGIHTWRNRILGANGSDPAIINLEDPPESTSSSPSLSSFSDESSEGSVLPPLSFLREVLEHIGVRVVECSSETMGRLIGKMVSDAVGKM